ncbi:NAD-dependent epimerase/dehydratase family protein [Profundibacter sp.]
MRLNPQITGGTIAVTGATGFIGGYLCAALQDQGYRVLRIGRGVPQNDQDRQTDYSEASLSRALQGADAVIHLAGRRMTREDAPMDIAPFLGPNVSQIADLVTASRNAGVRKIILASTIAIYSAASGLPYVETAPARPVNAYALSKLMAEAHLELLTRAGGPAAISLRLAAVYGHGEKGTPALMKFIDQARAGETIVLGGNADYRIDQLYVVDACLAMIAALKADVDAGIFNIGGGRAWSVDEIARTVNDVFGNAGNIRYETVSDAPMPKTVMALAAANRALGWSPAHDLVKGLKDFKATRDLVG